MPIIAIGFFIAARVREAAKTALVYVGGAMLLAACYFATPWASDLVLVMMKGPAMQADLIESRGHEAFTSYDYSYGLLDEGQEYLLVYDPTDNSTNGVVARFKDSEHCGLGGFHIVSSYYAIRYVVESKCN